MQLNHKPLRCLITGQSGTGKSTYQRRALLNLPAACRFVWDPEGEFASQLRLPAAATTDAMLAAVSRGWVIFDPGVLFPGEYERGFDFFCRWCFAAAQRIRGRKILAVDEVQKWTGTSAGSIPKGFALVLETGRRVGLDLLMVAQAANIIHNRLRAQVTEIVAFRAIEPNALKFAEGVGLPVEVVKGLRPGQFVARDLNTGAEARGQVFTVRT